MFLRHSCPDVQSSDICISEEDNRLLDSSRKSPSLATSCHGSESELQEEVVAIDGISTVSSRRFVPAQERRGAVRGKGKGRISRHSHTTGQRNRKITKRTYNVTLSDCEAEVLIGFDCPHM